MGISGLVEGKTPFAPDDDDARCCYMYITETDSFAGGKSSAALEIVTIRVDTEWGKAIVQMIHFFSSRSACRFLELYLHTACC